ncbi:MAG: hypothetical protein ACRD0M_09750, partial [Acidimicrobiales bacterium]
AWYRADASDARPDALLAHLEAACASAFGTSAGPWWSVEDAAQALEAAPAPAALVIDDLHTLRGTPAEPALERLLDYLPDGVALLLASRLPPALNLPRLRVSGELLELGPDDLRFRSWEVERLFRDVYGEPMRPEDLAELARRTEGWAAGLQLFHLATRGKTPDQRRRAIAALSTRSRLVREYLARNVIDELGDDVRDFVLRTAVLGRLNARLCDQLLDRQGSAAVLAELERGQVFTIALDEDGWYRYHEVLRSYAEAVFLEEAGGEVVRDSRRRAGALLETAGAVVEALEAYCRAEAWDAAARLVGLRGEQLVDGAGPWVDQLPPALIDQDPWIRLAVARRHRAAGRCDAAIESYRAAESAFGASRAASVCRFERLALAAWADPSITPSPGWAGLLRVAVTRDPLAAAAKARATGSPQGLFAAGVATLLAGRCREAEGLLRAAHDGDGASPALTASARLALGVQSLLAGDDTGVA